MIQNHLLKGMGMLYGVKETRPVCQLWMKGIFDSFLVLKEMLRSRGDNGRAPLGTQPHHGCLEGARRSPAPSKKLITLLWGRFASSYGYQPYLDEVSALCRNKVMGRAGWSRAAGTDWDACEMLQSPRV